MDNPTLLALETASAFASVAILHKGEVFFRANTEKNQTENLLPMVTEVLEEVKISLKKCDALCFGCGPGSFTGVRTACSVVQGLAFGLACPVIPVGNLRAVAEATRLAFFPAVQTMNFLSILDARMEEVYWAQYFWNNNAWQTIISPRVSSPEAVSPENIHAGNWHSCGQGLSAYTSRFSADVQAAAINPDFVSDAKAILASGGAAYQNQAIISSKELWKAQPEYVRNTVAQTIAQRMVKNT